jgi:hypothetical protein
MRRENRSVAMGAIACMVCALLWGTATVAVASPNLPPGSPNTVSGVVRDSAGDPVSCSVALMKASGGIDWSLGGGHTASSPEDGSYSFVGVPSGDYRVVFTAWQGFIGMYFPVPNYYPQVYNGRNLGYMEWWRLSSGDSPSAPGDLVHVPPSGSGPSGIDATLTLEPAAISGHVRDTSGTPIPGLTATLYGQEYGNEFRPFYSIPVGSDGSYAFRGLNAPFDSGPYSGDASSAPHYYVSFSDETSGAWNPQYYAGAQDFATATSIVTTGAPRVGIDATLTPAALSVTGTVRNAATGAPLSGITIEADASETLGGVLPGQVKCKSSADGTYELRGLVSGREYWISAGSEEWWSISGGGSLLYAGAPVPGYDFGMGPASARTEFLEFDEYWGIQDGLLDEQFFETGYTDVADVVIAPGDDRYADDAITAPGLCWAYQVTTPGSPNLGKNAPLIEIARSGDPLWAAQTIADIGLHNGSTGHRVTAHVVGTKTSVPDWILRRLRSYAAAVGVNLVVDRLAPKAGSSRYDLAAAVVLRMRARARASATDAVVMPGYAFVANGESQKRAMGPAACSAASASKGVPVLPVRLKSVPRPIARAIRTLKLSPRHIYLVGDSKSVAEKVRKSLKIPSGNRLLGAKRGSNRYTVAAAIANKATAKRWSSAKSVALADTPMDAIAAGAAIGDSGGQLLLESGDYEVQATTYRWVRAYSGRIKSLWFVGSDACGHSEDYESGIWDE